MVAYAMKRRVPCHMDPVTKDALVRRFAYCFEAPLDRAIRRSLKPSKFRLTGVS
ncbi:MAG: hypothetical protein HC841_02635 [Verrucomicrobiae bacterium]|nr:hypothetical protein [Verrucomicrobiae bacterium]